MTKNQEMLQEIPAEEWTRLDRFAASWSRRRATPWQAEMGRHLGGENYIAFNFCWN